MHKSFVQKTNVAPAAALQITSYALRLYGTKNGKTTQNLAVHFAKRTAKLTNFHKERYTSFSRVHPYVRKALCYMQPFFFSCPLTTIFSYLNRWTFYCPITTINTTVALQWFKSCFTLFTFVKIYTSICRHNFSFLVSAVRAGQY